MKSLADFNFKDKKVIVRCDFNVSIRDGKVFDDFRIKEVIPTINHLVENEAKVILISHLGQPKERDSKYSLKPIGLKLKELLDKDVKFLDDCQGRKIEKEIKKMENGQIVLLENLRFYPGEKQNDLKFAQTLAKLGDIYISEAFSVSHRNHASIATLPKLMPSGIGFLFGREIMALTKVKGNPAKPLVVIIGGIKISSKIKAIEKFLSKSDHLLLGGKIANIILRVKGICLGKPWPEEDVIKIIEKLKITDTKIHLPIDVVVSPNESGEVYIRETGPGSVRKEEEIFDIGPETIETFKKIIEEGKTIIWSGALGLAENEKFRQGTKSIAEAIARNHEAFKVAGGGDTTKLLNQFGLSERFSYISTGGGAMLNYLIGEKMPGIEALKQ
jgi:phosphoglycerate kinase